MGKTTNVKSVDEITPPTTTVASGRCTSAPMPVFNAIGINPKLATKAVIKTGLNRWLAPCLIAVTSSIPCSLNSLINDNITIPFRTAIPDKAMKPTAADIDNGISRYIKASTPPVNANGTPLKINRLSRIELNVV